jgi:hypothetical protein
MLDLEDTAPLVPDESCLIDLEVLSGQTRGAQARALVSTFL